MSDAPSLSVIIPIGPGDQSWTALVTQLRSSLHNAEIILCGGQAEAPSDFEDSKNTVWCKSDWGRAKQLNAGASRAAKQFLWFLHADTVLLENSAPLLIEKLEASPEAMHYFDLKFLNDGPKITAFNSWGANIRSKYFSLPFGDQGFGLSKANFEKLGTFDETVSYGEDHGFVWKAKRHGIEIVSTGSPIYTSARKYRERGWVRTTADHWLKTATQSVSEWLRG